MSLFPASPTDGQTTTVNGTLYTYDSAQTAWIRTNAAFTNALVVNGNISVSGSLTSGNLVDAVGYKGMPQNARTSQYTLALSDMGFHISITTGGIIIPANSSVAFPIGSTVVVYNNSATTQTISITTDTLRQAGTANSTEAVFLDAYGVATLIKIASTVWIVSGNVTSLTSLPVVNYLLVGGGGGGGGTLGGGGAGGQVQSGITNIQIGSSINTSIGAGGSGGTPVPDIFNEANQGNAGNATFATGLPTALGGAGGGGHDRNGTAANGTTTANGGGTGSWAGNDGGAGAAGGFAGGSGYSPDSPAGGGGGAGGPGGNTANSPLRSGSGGIGIDSAISGTLTNYGAGGGGSGSNNGGFVWSAGAAGGSSGGAGQLTAGSNAVANRGGGGGGGGDDGNGVPFNGGNGASGVAIFSYPTGSMTATGGTITTSGGNTIHTFTTPGTFRRTA